jgi:hypothetical protein
LFILTYVKKTIAAGLEEQPVDINNNKYRMDKVMAENTNVDAIVNGINFLGGAYTLGKSLIGEKFNVLNFKTDLEIFSEAKAGFNFVGTLPQVESELVSTITPDEVAEISAAVVALNVLKAGTNEAEAVTDGIALAVQIKNYCQKYF